MGVDYQAGIAYGIRIGQDELYDSLEKLYNKIHTFEELKSYFPNNEYLTYSYFKQMKKNGYNFGEFIELLYEQIGIVNTDCYCNSGDFILGYALQNVDWGTAVTLDPILLSANDRSEKDIAIRHWYKILFPERAEVSPDMILYCQVL